MSFRWLLARARTGLSAELPGTLGRIDDLRGIEPGVRGAQNDQLTRFLATADEFVTKAKDENSGANLRLDAALAEAGKGEARAADSLRSFLREFPNARRSAEAWVALAELAFHATPPRIDEARKDLSRAAELKPSDAAQERADYLMIWLEDATASGDAKVIELAKKFIQQHEASSLIASVRMKLGEMYFRAQDFANAEKRSVDATSGRRLASSHLRKSS